MYNKKYSFIIPYYKRDSFAITLKTFENLYKRNDFEIIVIEDLKNKEDNNEHNKLKNIISSFKFNFKHLQNDINTYNPCVSFNIGAKAAEGEFLIFTNPECFHETNILNGLDFEFEKDKSVYVVCANKSVELINPPLLNNKINYHLKEWYQHSKYSNRCLHFCSSLSAINFNKIGGFDEQYRHGIAYEDDDFLHSIMHNNIKIIQRDDLISCHIAHCRGYMHTNMDLVRHNLSIFNKKWNQNRTL
jgi:hypothetical protein